MKQKGISLIVAAALACAAAGLARGQEAPAERPARARKPSAEARAKYMRQAMARAAGGLMEAAAGLPAAEEALAKYREQAGELEQQLAALRRQCIQEIAKTVGDAADPARAKEIAEKYRGEMLPLLEKLVALRLSLCEELLRVAKGEPKAVAAAEMDRLVQRLARFRMKMRAAPQRRRVKPAEGARKGGDVKF